jgi:predicted nucleic acid-binding protein
VTAVVIDASAALHLAAASTSRRRSRPEWHAPRLLRSELLSALHAQVWRGVVPSGAARQMLHVLDSLEITLFSDERRLHDRAWTLADELGWAKTYDAEYVALADILGLPLLTVDGRLARGVGHLVTVVGPVDLGL